MNLNFISSQILQAAIAVHRALGPGLLESVYQKCMVIELERMGMGVESEVELPIFYRDQKITDLGFRIDLLVESVIIVELRAAARNNYTSCLSFGPATALHPQAHILICTSGCALYTTQNPAQSCAIIYCRGPKVC